MHPQLNPDSSGHCYPLFSVMWLSFPPHWSRFLSALTITVITPVGCLSMLITRFLWVRSLWQLAFHHGMSWQQALKINFIGDKLTFHMLTSLSRKQIYKLFLETKKLPDECCKVAEMDRRWEDLSMQISCLVHKQMDGMTRGTWLGP